ncbi:MAG TPA: ABC transporter permease [Gaiellaceae bacterium]|nr:ABC transporter permease [Gaiellaceae bacterium]
MSLLLHQLRVEQRLFWRSREAAIFVFLFPLLLFLLLGAVYDGEIEGYAAASWLLVGMIGYGVANTALGGLAIFLVLRRESGILKRLRSTPLPGAVYLTAVVASTLIVFALEVAVLVVVGRLLFDAALPQDWASLVLALVLGAAAFAGMGFGLASLVRSSEGASPIVNVIILPMAFLSGSFGPTREYPDVLQALAEVLPLSHFLDLVRASYLEGEGLWERPGAIAVVALWGAAGFALAARRFRWSPTER